MLSFHQVNLSFDHRALYRDMSLEINERRLLITGPNGAGKTTLLLLAGGLLEPDSGEITWHNSPVSSLSCKPRIGISASKITLPGFMTVRDLLTFHSQQFAVSLNQTLLEQTGLDQFTATRVDDLSLGNAKKLSLMLALNHQPELLLLDEPGNGLDVQTRQVLDDIIYNFDGQIVMASHEESELTDNWPQLSIEDIAIARAKG